MALYPAPENVVLRAAIRANRGKLFRELEYVRFEAGRRFWSRADTTPFALFPLRGVISLQLSDESGKQANIGILGSEGFAGVPLVFGAGRTPVVPVAITSGEAFTMSPEVFRNHLRNRAFKAAVDHYLMTFFSMVSHISVCNRLHVIEKTCVSWLLLMHDRTRQDSFQITQDFLSRILGVRRASVSRVAAALQRSGAIDYDKRGTLTILDRNALEARACSCYRAIKAETERFATTRRPADD